MANLIVLLLFAASICTLGSCHRESPFALSIDKENEMNIVPGEIEEGRHIERVIGRKRRSAASDDGLSFNQEVNNDVKNVNNTPSMSQSNVKTKLEHPLPVPEMRPILRNPARRRFFKPPPYRGSWGKQGR